MNKFLIMFFLYKKKICNGYFPVLQYHVRSKIVHKQSYFNATFPPSVSLRTQWRWLTNANGDLGGMETRLEPELVATRHRTSAQIPCWYGDQT